ncbi:MAG: ABC transporter ATP-binding protein [Fuerstiella sp.]|nr:ABC transporter ATP-binding protein [Fuerstiella sp.]MCP4507914.1 ABC transporter ATP-binding protein [Fuerstiella sp.]
MVIEITSLSHTFNGSHEALLNIPRLTLGNRSLVSIVGSSGSGKSTLLRIIAGLLSPTAGHVSLDGHSPQQKRDAGELAFIFQSPTLLPWRTAMQNIVLPCELQGGRLSRRQQDVHGLLSLVGLSEDDTRKRPAQLSGGMQMRVSLARSLITRPELMLMDEPFAALDDILRTQLQDEVRRIHCEQKIASVLVTHNIREAVAMSDRVLVLGDKPAQITTDVTVALPAERDSDVRRSREFQGIVNQVTDALYQVV